MKKITLLFVLLLALANAWAQKEYPVDNFHEVTISGNIKATLEPGDVEKVVLYVEGIPENEITVKVSQGVLRISSMNSFMYKDEVIKAYVTYKELRGVRANAGSIVANEKEITADQFLVRAGSGAQLTLQVNVKSIDGSASEGAQLRLHGQAETQECLAATGGQYEASGLATQKTYVRANTGGRAEVSAKDLLEISANTGGEVTYYGEPAKKYVKSLLGGDVRQRNDKME